MRALAVTQGPGSPLQVREVPAVTPGTGAIVIHTLVSTINCGERTRLAVASDGHVFGWDVVGLLVDDCPALHLPAGAAVVALAGTGGGWAERSCVQALDVAPVPAAVSLSAAATLPVSGLTALRAVTVHPQLLGASVLVTGAGAVASYAVQLARLAGATVHAIARSPESARHLTSLGASAVTRPDEDWPGGFDVVVDTVGGVLMPRAIAAARAFGHVVVVGNLGDPGPGVSSGDLLSSGATVQGYRLVVDAERRPVGADLAILVGLVASGALVTPEVREIDWTDARLVDEAVSAGFGGARTVLRIGSA